LELFEQARQKLHTNMTMYFVILLYLKNQISNCAERLDFTQNSQSALFFHGFFKI
jgi:hypothetical protein